MTMEKNHSSKKRPDGSILCMFSLNFSVWTDSPAIEDGLQTPAET